VVNIHLLERNERIVILDLDRSRRSYRVPIKLVNVHDPARCAGEICVVHNPTNHHMRGWALTWRNDRGLFERVCLHGAAHPDPDQFPFWRKMGDMFMSVHGCCEERCCIPDFLEGEIIVKEIER